MTHFYSELDEILAARHSITPACLLSSTSETESETVTTDSEEVQKKASSCVDKNRRLVMFSKIALICNIYLTVL